MALILGLVSEPTSISNQVQPFNLYMLLLLSYLYFLNHVSNNVRSRGSTFRSRENPLGRKDSQACHLGNLLCARALILVVLAAAKGCFWILEQPQSSCMQWHQLFQKLMAMIPVRRISIAMSNFGGPTPKRTYLYTGDLKSHGKSFSFHRLVRWRAKDWNWNHIFSNVWFHCQRPRWDRFHSWVCGGAPAGAAANDGPLLQPERGASVSWRERFEGFSALPTAVTQLYWLLALV